MLPASGYSHCMPVAVTLLDPNRDWIDTPFDTLADGEEPWLRRWLRGVIAMENARLPDELRQRPDQLKEL